MVYASDLIKDEYTVKEVADMIGVTSPTIINWSKRKKVEIQKVKGRHWFVKKDDLVALLKSLNVFQNNVQSKSDLERTEKTIVYLDDSKQSSDEMQRALSYIFKKKGQNPIILMSVSGNFADARNKFKELVRMAAKGEVTKLILLEGTEMPTSDKEIFDIVCAANDIEVETVGIDEQKQEKGEVV